MDTKTVIQSEVSQKEKNEYCKSMHKYMGNLKNGIDDLICKPETETCRTNAWIPRQGGMNRKIDIDTHTLLILK